MPAVPARRAKPEQASRCLPSPPVALGLSRHRDACRPRPSRYSGVPVSRNSRCVGTMPMTTLMISTYSIAVAGWLALIRAK